MWQWHPFSISTYPNDDSVMIHIRVLGDWTKKFHTLVKTQSKRIPNNLKDLTIYIEGPYGKINLPLHKYKQIILISGGIGVTPLQSVFNEIMFQLQHNNHRFLDNNNNSYNYETTNYNYDDDGDNSRYNYNYNELSKVHFIWSVSDPHVRIRKESKIDLVKRSGHWAAVDYEKEYTQSFYFNMETSLPTGTYTQSNVNSNMMSTNVNRNANVLSPMSMGLAGQGNSLRIDHDTNVYNMSNDMMSGTGITKYSGDFNQDREQSHRSVFSSNSISEVPKMSNAGYRRLPSYFVPDLLNVQQLRSTGDSNNNLSDNQIVQMAAVTMHTINESVSSIGKDDLQRINFDNNDDNYNQENVEIVTDFYITRVKSKNKQISLQKQYPFLEFNRPNIDEILKNAKDKYMAKSNENDSNCCS